MQADGSRDARSRRPRVRPSKELAVVRRSGGLEQAAGAAAEVVQVDASLLRLLRDALREVEGLVDDRGAGGRIVAHVVEDRALGARGDDRVGHALDPDTGAAAVAPLAFCERVEPRDLGGARGPGAADGDQTGGVPPTGVNWSTRDLA